MLIILSSTAISNCEAMQGTITAFDRMSDCLVSFESCPPVSISISSYCFSNSFISCISDEPSFVAVVKVDSTSLSALILVNVSTLRYESVSISNKLQSFSFANLDERLIAIVLLPLPPFSLQIVITIIIPFYNIK